MQCVRDRYPALVSPATNTMQLLMWQHDIVGVAHYIKDCIEVLGALGDAPDDALTSSPRQALMAPPRALVTAEAVKSVKF